jgi:ligand-binding SRPBCC domain-containing protein
MYNPLVSNYLLRREQFIAHPVERVFSFFSDARNLERITPPWLRFEVLTAGPIELRAGALIQYRIGWGMIPLRWTTEIVEWCSPHRFMDVQLRGPYRLWQHTHRFEPVEGGTRMTDEVEYALPLGPLGRLAHALKVRLR